MSPRTFYSGDHRRPNPPLEDNAFRAVTDDLIARDEKRAEIMQVVRDALYEADIEKVARDINRSERCLYSIRGGYTRWPRWETLMALLPALGLEIMVYKVRETRH